MIKGDGLIIYGLGMGTATRYIDRDGTVREGFWTVVGGGGRELVEPMLALGAYDAPCAVAYASTTLNPTYAYRLSGTAVPTGYTVHLSQILSQIGDGALTPRALEEGEFAAVEPDGEGAWSYECPAGRSGTLYAWILLDAGMLDALDAAVTVKAEAANPEPQSTVLTCRQTVSGLTSPDGIEMFGLTYRYTCPEDVTSIELCEVIEETVTEPCPNCGGGGSIEGPEAEPCPDCGGIGMIETTIAEPCPECGGSGMIETTIAEPCPECGGSGMIEDETCPSCGGTGMVDVTGTESCPNCGGSGSSTAVMETPCSTCGGTGSIGGSGWESCPSCGGTGTVETAAETETCLAVSPVSGGSGSVHVDFCPSAESVTLLWRCRTRDANGTMSITVTETTETTASCLSGDTLITMADGTRKRLDALTADDTVLGGDGRPAGIIRLSRGIWSERHVLCRFEDGTVIDAVHDHRFYNAEQGFWQLLSRWKIGEHTRRSDGTEIALASADPVEELAERYNLWVERGSYWANGLLSGDASANRPLLAEATAEQAADMAASLDERAILKLFGMEGMMP